MSFSSDEDDASTATEGAGGEQDGDRDDRESNEDETSETLVQEEASHAHRYDLVTHTE